MREIELAFYGQWYSFTLDDKNIIVDVKPAWATDDYHKDFIRGNVIGVDFEIGKARLFNQMDYVLKTFCRE